MTTTIGALGSSRRATVTPWGAIEPWDGSPVLDWWVAADDRWHVPADEPTVRQRRLRGAPVVETSIRVPGGDAVHRAYAVADEGGLIVVEVENRSSLPFAVAFSRRDLRTARPPVDVPAPGITLPADAVVVPVAHRATVRVVLGAGAGPLPAALPTSEQVARGWLAQTDLGVRVVVPDEELAERLVAARATLALEGPGDPGDRAGWLLGVAEVTRMGVDARPLVDEVAEAATYLARAVRRSASVRWDVPLALAATGEVLGRAGEAQAVADTEALLERLPPVEPLPDHPDHGEARLAAWVVRRLVGRVEDGVELLPTWPAGWVGQGVEVYRAPVRGALVSFAVRWHGERPALLWESTAPVRLRCPGLDPSWSAEGATGEALLRPFGPPASAPA